MALAEILAAMQLEAEDEICRINEQSNATIAEIRAAAQADARQIRENCRRQLLQPLRQERAKRLNRARLAGLRAVGHAREELFAEAKRRAQMQLENARAKPDYPEVLRALVEEALAEIEGEALLRADARDENVLKTLLPGQRIQFDLTTWGGVEARATDGRIVVLNTLEARLEQAEESLRRAVIPLFDGEAQKWVTMTMQAPDFVR